MQQQGPTVQRPLIHMTAFDDFDPMAPQREAALFYGLFLRGHSADSLRRDIEVPRPVLEKWLKRPDYQPIRENLKRIYHFRRRVLAIFDELVGSQRIREEVH